MKTLALIIFPLFLFGQASQDIKDVGISLDRIAQQVEALERLQPPTSDKSDFQLFHFNDYSKKLGNDLIFNAEGSATYVKDYIPTVSITYDARNGNLIRVHFSGIKERLIDDHNYRKGLIAATFNGMAYSFDKWGNRDAPYQIFVDNPKR